MIEYIDKEIIDYAYESLKNSNCKEVYPVSNKGFIFNPFIEIFNTKSSFPSKFVNTNLNDFYVVKYLWYDQNVISDNITTYLMETISNLNNRIIKYESLTNDLIDIITKA
jgi:hypothetical protein